METGTQDYGLRIYNPALGKFLSVDPLTSDYPSWSPYPFAMNRPIDGIDLDGAEWDKVTNNGTTDVSVNTAFSTSEDVTFNSEQISQCQKAITNLFNQVLEASSNGSYKGKVTFNGGTSDRLIPSIDLYAKKHEGNEDDPMIAGFNARGSIGINVYNKDGSMKSIDDIAEDAVHELLHTLRIDHPFETTQGPSTALVNIGIDTYATTSTTDQNIFYNIMNYGMIVIDGQRLGDLWKNKRPILMTTDQIELMSKEIDMQKKGYGAQPKYDKSQDLRQNEERFLKYYENYWNELPGTPVEKKK